MFLSQETVSPFLLHQSLTLTIPQEVNVLILWAHTHMQYVNIKLSQTHTLWKYFTGMQDNGVLNGALLIFIFYFILLILFI